MKKIILILVAMGSILMACSTEASDSSFDARGYSSTDKLVSAEWLNENIDSVKIIDVRKAEDYDLGHIPGALRLTPNEAFQWESDEGVKGMLPSAEHIASALSSLGIEENDTVIFYDGNSNLWASRGLWALEVYGHEDTRLLDGSWNYWSQNNLPISTEKVTAEKSDYNFSGNPKSSLIASWDEILDSVEDPSKIVCDTRSPDEYAGKDLSLIHI